MRISAGSPPPPSASLRGLLAALRVVLPAVAAVACGGGGTSTGPGQVPTGGPTLTVVLPQPVLEVGQTTQATAIATDARGNRVPTGEVSWSTGATTIATAFLNGTVAARALGETTVIATALGRTASATLTVVPVPVAALSIVPTAPEVRVGSTLALRATVLDRNGNTLGGRAVTWRSTDPAVATVTPSGEAAGVAIGLVTLVASVEQVTVSMTLRVTASAGSVAAVTVAPASPRLLVGEALQLTATVRDAAGQVLANRPVRWLLSQVTGDSLATLSPSGRLVARRAGTVVVEAEADGVVGSARVILADSIDSGIAVRFAAPVEREVIGDTLIVKASVSSAAPIRQVVATLGDLSVTLAPEKVGFLGLGTLWVGRLIIGDLKFGPYDVTVTATDERGVLGRASISFTRDTRTGEGGTTVPPKNK